MRFSVALLALLLLSISSQAQDVPAIRYEVGWGAANDHWFRVTMHVGGHEGEHLDVRMPHWRPGTYVVQNYARNVLGVEAATSGGRSLPLAKMDRNTWRIETPGVSEVVVTYRQWANQRDAGASYVGQGVASLNPISTLMNIPGRDLERTAISFAKPEDWKVATPLEYDPSIGAWPAADYHELIDSPFLISREFNTHTFEVKGATIEIVVHGGWVYDADRLVEHHRRLVEAQFELMQDVPTERYVFLYQFLPSPMGHGVEHRNSTSIVLGPASAIVMPEDMSNPGFYGAVLGVASHEFFHLWNVERIRPGNMDPVDYSREQYSTQMWVFEGTTSYFTEVALLRAGLISRDRFLHGMASTVGSFDSNPGRKVTSVAMSSFDSWARQEDAPPHTWYSYYTAGQAMGLALDLEVRGRTGNTNSLDDVMRLLNERYGKTGTGMPEGGFRQALEEITGTSFEAFFADHIHGTKDVDWDAHLLHAGLRLDRRTDERRPSVLGVDLDGARIAAVHPGSGAFQAGLDIDDVITELNGQVVEDPIVNLFADMPPGTMVELTVERWGSSRSVEVKLGASTPSYFFVPVEAPTESQQRVLDDWTRTGTP